MSHKSHGNPVATYIITALILGVITYIEYAIVEFEIAWLSSGWILFWLFALSIVKFVMVVAIFMHLKDDEKTYTGFFSSGMLIALATFLILPLLFTVRQAADRPPVAAPIDIHGEEGTAQGEEEARAAAEPQRSRADVLDNPPPADRSLVIEPPAASESQATLRANEAETDGVQEEGAQAAQAGEEAEGASSQEPAPQEESVSAAADFDRELGEGLYASNCQGCHQANGEGLPGVFPPLANNMAQLYNAEGGREYLIDVVLHGLTGQIEVNGQSYNGVMPPWSGSLDDEQIAAVLNHELTAWGNEEQLDDFTPVSANEVAALRDQDPGDLNERRAQLQIE